MIKFLLKLVVLSVCVLVPATQSFSQDETNGVNGGYVGSDRWFVQMRQSAANQAMLRSIAGARSVRESPPDFVEFAGQIVFPDGRNPFPGGHFPDLRIKSTDANADAVERAPFVSEDGGFYSVFKKGQSYDVSWMYMMGGREKFFSLTIDPNAPRQLKQAIPYTPGKSNDVNREGASGSELGESPNSPSRNPGANSDQTPADVSVFDLSGVPNPPTTFLEQQLLDLARSNVTSWRDHEKLAKYYQTKGDAQRANAEFARAKYWREH